MAVGSDLPVTCGQGTFFPAIQSGFPAFAARSSKVQYNGKSGRSCSPN